jgi:hypothetical protein
MYALLEVLMYKTPTRVLDARYYQLAYRHLTPLVPITSLVSTPAVTQGWWLAYLQLAHRKLKYLRYRAEHTMFNTARPLNVKWANLSPIGRARRMSSKASNI